MTKAGLFSRVNIFQLWTLLQFILGFSFLIIIWRYWYRKIHTAQYTSIVKKWNYLIWFVRVLRNIKSKPEDCGCASDWAQHEEGEGEPECVHGHDHEGGHHQLPHPGARTCDPCGQTHPSVKPLIDHGPCHHVEEAQPQARHGPGDWVVGEDEGDPEVHHQPAEEEGGGGEEGAEHTGQPVARQTEHCRGEGARSLDTPVDKIHPCQDMIISTWIQKFITEKMTAVEALFVPKYSEREGRNTPKEYPIPSWIRIIKI